MDASASASISRSFTVDPGWSIREGEVRLLMAMVQQKPGASRALQIQGIAPGDVLEKLDQLACGEKSKSCMDLIIFDMYAHVKRQSIPFTTIRI
jgi:hypothetical protein